MKFEPSRFLHAFVCTLGTDVGKHSVLDMTFFSFLVLSTHIISMGGKRLKAARAKKLLQKKEEEKAKALAAGMDWQSDDSSDYEPPVCLFSCEL